MFRRIGQCFYDIFFDIFPIQNTYSDLRKPIVAKLMDRVETMRHTIITKVHTHILFNIHSLTLFNAQID